MSEKKPPIHAAEKEIISIFEHITSKILPADKDTANETMTTADFTEIIKQHYPQAESLTDATVYNLLLDNDYQYELIDNSIVWLVKKT